MSGEALHPVDLEGDLALEVSGAKARFRAAGRHADLSTGRLRDALRIRGAAAAGGSRHGALRRLDAWLREGDLELTLSVRGHTVGRGGAGSRPNLCGRLLGVAPFSVRPLLLLRAVWRQSAPR